MFKELTYLPSANTAFASEMQYITFSTSFLELSKSMLFSLTYTESFSEEILILPSFPGFISHCRKLSQYESSIVNVSFGFIKSIEGVDILKKVSLYDLSKQCHSMYYESGTC